MKVLFLGGCGEMAAAMLPLLRDDNVIESVTLADISGERARAVAAQWGPRFHGIEVDASWHDQLVGAMTGHECVINYIGPFYRFEKPCAAAAIEAGVPYVSIADDYDAFLNVWELEDAARAANVKILSGFGNSPGLTQILAKLGYLSMDAPREIRVNWGAGSNEKVGPANILHVMHLMTGKTPQWRDGRRAWVQTGDGKKLVNFPEPVGEIPVFYTGHAESVTLPMFLPGLRYVSLHGGTNPAWIFPFVSFLSQLGITKTHARRSATLKFMSPFLPLFSGSSDPNKSVGRIEVTGTHQGQFAERIYTYVGHIAHITSVPCYLAVRGLLTGEFDGKPGGVYAPERIVDDPAAFVEKARALGVEIHTVE